MPRPDRTPPAGDRAAKIQKAGAASQRRRGSLIWGAAALVLALIAGAVVAAVILDSPATADLSAVREYDHAALEHSGAPVDYEQTPPVGGPHHPAWWNCGVYPDEIPREHAVHSLEHGAVWLTYQPDLPADQLSTLEELGGQEFMLVSPLAAQESPVVATAWDHQLALDSADEQTLQAFVREYKQGPQTPEPGAACTGGTVTDLVGRS